RFVTNTTFGIVGIFDVASEAGMAKHDEDFGQTMGVWGLDTGPYLVLPIFGPSNVRDGAGRLVDSYGYMPWKGPEYVGIHDYVAWRNALTAVDVINTRANLLDAISVMEEAALDRYSFVRDAYLQRRRSQVNDGRSPDRRSPDRNSRAHEMLEMDAARIPADLRTMPAEVSSQADSEALIAQLPK
ncbi:MAG TPA: VacJ family lipoprotein, partial [Burkholderiales bacterium]|nr:VacJ family lipoprotein [Burkholderiales bacterium]